MPTQQHTSKSKSEKAKKAPAKKTEAKVKAGPVKTAAKAKKQEPVKVAAKPEAKKQAPAGAKAVGPDDFVITRKWDGKEIEAKAGTHIRVELPENATRGMSWQLQKLPHGVHLDQPEVAKADGLNQNRIFNFSVQEEGDYLLQFNLARGFGGQMADTFRVKVTKKAD
jgi:predicted secreted protein